MHAGVPGAAHGRGPEGGTESAVSAAAAAARPATLEQLLREVGFMRRVSRGAIVVQIYGASLQHAADAVLVME